MASAARRSRLILASEVVAGVLAAAVLAAGCGGSASHLGWVPAKPSALLSSAPGVRDMPASAGATRSRGVAGRYRVGEREMVLAEPAHVGVTGQHLGVTLAFFGRYLLGDKAAMSTITRAADSGGIAALDSGGRLPPGIS